MSELERVESSSIKNCGFALNCINSITTNNYTEINFNTKNNVFDSYYNSKVELELRYDFDKYNLETKKNNIHIKLIDVNEHDLNINVNYSISYLLQLESPVYTCRSYNIDLIFAIVQYIDFLESMNIIFKIPVIIALCNVIDLENAFWNGSYLVFGAGNNEPQVTSPRMIRPLTSSAIVAHELSHALIQYICNLEYKGHSGALNEAYADILGVCLEDYILQKYHMIGWEIGSELYEKSALRSMQDPHKYKQPKVMYDRYYINPTSMIDYGGVHINSGIINHIFYQFCEVMTKKEALSIFIEVLYKLHKNSDFKEFKSILINSIDNKDLISNEVINIINISI